MAYEPVTSTAATDNDSISTAMAENHFLTSHDEVKEYVVKFLFRLNTSSHNTEVAQTHYNILCCITHLYPEAQVYDNFGKTMKEFLLLKTFDTCLHHFKLQFVKANPNKKCNAIYLTFHRIRSSVSISKIRKNSEAAALLSKPNEVCLSTKDATSIVGCNSGLHAGKRSEGKVSLPLCSLTIWYYRYALTLHIAKPDPAYAWNSELNTTLGTTTRNHEWEPTKSIRSP